MPEQLQRGADEELSELLSLLDWVDRFIREAAAEIRSDPAMCGDDLQRALAHSRKLRTRLASEDGELRKMLRRRERKAKEDEQWERLAAATAAMEAATRRLEGENVSRPDFKQRSS